jgi:signal transduction histidine kinase
MADNLLMQAGMIADGSKAAVVFEDAEDAESLLNTVHTNRSIFHAGIHTPDGEDFAEYERDDFDEDKHLPMSEEDGCVFGDDYMVACKAIVLDGETIGFVYLYSDLRLLHESLMNNVFLVLAALFVASLVAYLISSRLQKVISGPILNLNDIAQKVTSRKDYSVRASRQSNDEVGMLIGSFNDMLETIQQRDMQLVAANENLEEKVRDRTAELTREIDERRKKEDELRGLHEDLVVASHRAGMAEVATDVLHNVGNVLNSVNVSVDFIKDKVANSKILNLNKVADMIAEHTDDLGTFLTEDARGKHIPSYLIEVAKLVDDERTDLGDKLNFLAKNIEHIKEIVRTQQAYARVGGVEVLTSIIDIIEDAVEINSTGLNRHGVKAVLELGELPKVCVDKQRVLQILVNLINNAKYAVKRTQGREKLITIRCKRHGEDRLQIEVSDNGIGISRENLDKIFRHGYTTKEGGHGFGLHSGALAAAEMGGRLAVDSDGPGHGATFTLELPFNSKEQVQCIR